MLKERDEPYVETMSRIIFILKTVDISNDYLFSVLYTTISCAVLLRK